MSDDFNPRCRRRQHARRLVDQFGAGSGGDPGVQESAGGCKWLTAQKDIWLVGNEIHLQTGTSTEMPEPYLIEMLAVDSGGDNGRIEMRGSQSVRITSGVPEGSGGPPIGDNSTNGIDVMVGDGQNIYVQRGFPPDELVQSIQLMADGNMYIDGGDTGSISITCGKSISISVAGGTSITLTPAGIVMKGPLIRIN